LIAKNKNRQGRRESSWCCCCGQRGGGRGGLECGGGDGAWQD